MRKWIPIAREDFYRLLEGRTLVTKEIKPDENKPILVLRYYEEDSVIAKMECYGKDCNGFYDEDFYNSNFA